MINNYQNTGLNGGFSDWLKGACRWLIDWGGNYINASTGSVGSRFVSKMQARLTQYFDGGANDLWRAASPIEPTASEAVFLDAFAAKLKPFVVNVLNSLDQSLTVANANVQLYKMAVAKEYFLYNETAGLSQNAISIRLSLINEAFTPIEEIITEKLGAISGLPVKITANQADFNALFQDSVQGQVYAVRQYPNNAAAGGSNIAINPISTTKSPTRNATVFEPVIKDSIFQPAVNPVKDLSPVKAVNPVITFDPAITVKPIVDQPTNATVPVKDTIDKTFKYVGYGLLAITAAGVIKSFFKKNKQ